MLPQFASKVKLGRVITVGVGGLVEPDVVLRTCRQVPLDANLVLILGLGEQGAGPVGAFLVHAPDERRFEIPVGARCIFPSAYPFVFRFLYVGIVRDNYIEGVLEGKVQGVLRLDKGG